MNNQALWAIIIFLVSYGIIVSEKIHRTIVAMVGAVLVVALGIVSQETALHHIDFNTIGLLVGMMIIVGITAETGLFAYLGIWASQKVQARPTRILIALCTLTAVGSAFLDNVTTVLLMVPVTFSITRKLKLSPIPFLIAEIISSNIGGTATLIGDPPNIMIGSAVPELGFMSFINNLALISFVIFLVSIPLLAFICRKQLVTEDRLKQELMAVDAKQLLTNIPLLKKSLTVLGLTIVGFFLHQAVHIESATIALAGAFLLLLLTGEHMMEKTLEKVEWTTIFFFVGLFVLVSGLIETGVISSLAEKAMELTGGNVTAASLLILWISAIASAFLDNIPFVATMIPMIQEMSATGIANAEPLWWSLALGACLGGNGTLIGASANLIAAGMSAREGHPISFFTFFRIGFPLMLISIGIASIYVYLRYLM